MLEVTVAGIQFEHLRETLGIGFSQPRLSWQIEIHRGHADGADCHGSF